MDQAAGLRLPESSRLPRHHLLFTWKILISVPAPLSTYFRESSIILGPASIIHTGALMRQEITAVESSPLQKSDSNDWPKVSNPIEFDEWMIQRIEDCALDGLAEKDIAEELGITYQRLLAAKANDLRVREALKEGEYTDTEAHYALHVQATRNENPTSRKIWSENKSWLEKVIRKYEMRVALQESRKRMAETDGAGSN